jgi:predicted nucleic acid-binding protein
MEFMNDVINSVPNISAITKIEVLGFNAAGEHYKLLTDFMDDANILGLTDNVIDASIAIRKNHKTKLPDVIIAATAIVNNLVLVSRNVSDFKNMQGLKVVDPYNFPTIA